jgi:hypothetical protein
MYFLNMHRKTFTEANDVETSCVPSCDFLTKNMRKAPYSRTYAVPRKELPSRENDLAICASQARYSSSPTLRDTPLHVCTQSGRTPSLFESWYKAFSFAECCRNHLIICKRAAAGRRCDTHYSGHGERFDALDDAADSSYRVMKDLTLSTVRSWFPVVDLIDPTPHESRSW